jgi:hypothetical protein
VAGISNVYPYTGAPGEVDVYAESETEVDGVPTQAQLEAVFDAIEADDNGLASRRPANAFVNVLPITRTGFDVTVWSLSGNDLAALQEDVRGAIETYFLQSEPFIVGLDVPPRRDVLSTLDLVSVINDVVRASGGEFSGASFAVAGGASVLHTYSLGQGEKAKAAGVVFS